MRGEQVESRYVEVVDPGHTLHSRQFGKQLRGLWPGKRVETANCSKMYKASCLSIRII